MSLRAVKIFAFVSFFCASYLSSCGGITPMPQLTSPNISNSSDAEKIKPENIDKLQIIGKWGKGNVYGAALSPDEKTLAVATATGVYLYDNETLQQKQFIDLPIVAEQNKLYSFRQAISFSPDGNLLAIAHNGIKIWNLSTNKYEKWIDNRIADYKAVHIAFTPHGNAIVVMSMGTYQPCDSTGGNFALYDIKTQDLLYNDYFCPESSLFYFNFTDNGSVIFVGKIRDDSDWINKVSFVNAATGNLLRELNFKENIESVSPDGSKISIRNSGASEIIDTITQKKVNSVDGIAIFLPESQNLLIAKEESVQIVTSESKTVCSFENSLRLTFDVYRSTYTIARDKLVFWNSLHQNVEIWDLTQCKLINQLFIPTGQDSLRYSNNGFFLATSSSSGVHLFDGKSGKHIFSIPGARDYDFSKDSKTVVAISGVDISFWDLISGKKVKTIPTDSEYTYHVSLNPDGKIVATIDYDGVHLWDVKNRSLLSTISGRFENISWNPNDNNFVLTDDNSLVFRNAENGDIEKKILIPKKHFNAFFSTDWTYMAIIEDTKVELWDMDGHKIKDFMQYIPINPADESPRIYNLQFSPDNKLLVAVLYDYGIYTIRFWDTQTGVILRDVAIPFSVSGIAFSPDGKSLTILGDGIIYIIGVKTP